MKNLIIIIVYLFISVSLFSQESFKSGEVIYNLKVTPESSFENPLKPNKFRDFQKKVNRFSEKLKYTLKFNKKSSLFYLNSDLGLDNQEGFNKLALILNKGDNVFFVDTKKKIMIEEKPFFGESFLVKSSTSDLKWKLINEKKVIGKYTCYKATVQKKNNGPSDKVAPFSTYIAWYCPDVPFNYGPFDFNSLPGLILELSIKDRTYIASIIKLKQEVIEIDQPNKGKLVTKEEFESIGKKAFENR